MARRALSISPAADATASRPDILRTIHAQMESFSAGQRTIARIILDDPAWAVQANVEELASRARVSAPTIVRFARATGCAGLKDFKIKLAGALALGTPYLHRSVRPDDAAADIVRNIVGSVTSVAAEWQRQLDPRALEQAAEAAHRARRTDCYGTGVTSHFLAQELQARLFRLGLTANAFSDAHLQLVAAATLTPEDALIAISFVGRMPTLLQSVKLGKARGATIVAVTRSNTPLAELADILLSTDVPKDATMHVGTDATIVQLLVIEMLTVVIGLKRGPETMKHLGDVHRVLQTHGIDSDDPSLLRWGWQQIAQSSG